MSIFELVVLASNQFDCMIALIGSERSRTCGIVEYQTAAGSRAERIAIRAVEKHRAGRFISIQRNGTTGRVRAPKVDFRAGSIGHAAQPIQLFVPAQWNGRAVHREHIVREPLGALTG